jgi:hypothetical protein
VSENKEASAEEKNPESKKRINITNISKPNLTSPSASIVLLYVTLAKLYKTSNYVIPAKAGIQYYQVSPRFRVKPGMTNRGILQSSLYIVI